MYVHVCSVCVSLSLAVIECCVAVALMHGLMFDPETQRNGYTMIIDTAGFTSKDFLSLDETYVETSAYVDELSMIGMPVICNKILHINVPMICKPILRFCRLIFPKNLGDCACA